MTDPLPLVYLYGPAERTRTGELRWSLRTLVNLPHGRITVAGWAPPWLDRARVDCLPVEPVGDYGEATKYHQTTANLLAACEHMISAGASAFVLMNDDFFVLRPVGKIPILRGGPLHHDPRLAFQNVYGQAHRRTLEILEGCGVARPWSYELHTPMVVNPHVMAPILRTYGDLGPICKRTLYGNLAGCGGIETADPKVYRPSDPTPSSPFMSTSETAWYGRPGHKVRLRFSDPSPYELQGTERPGAAS